MNDVSSVFKSQKHIQDIPISEHKFPYESFIGGWYIPENICDNIVNHFNEQKEKKLTTIGNVDNYGKKIINQEIKDSEEFQYYLIILIIHLKNIEHIYKIV